MFSGDVFFQATGWLSGLVGGDSLVEGDSLVADDSLVEGGSLVGDDSLVGGDSLGMNLRPGLAWLS